jgi:hypothetical protein
VFSGFVWTCLTPSTDVADKLGLIPPIAEQCQHKWVIWSAFTLQSTCSWLYSAACFIANGQKRSMREWLTVQLCGLCLIESPRPLYKKYSIGTTVWSPLASGLLSGKVRFMLAGLNHLQ